MFTLEEVNLTSKNLIEIFNEEEILYDRNGGFVGRLIGRYVFDKDMKPILYISRNHLWRWEDRRWVGEIIDGAVFNDSKEIVFVTEPRKRYKKTKATKPSEKAVRPRTPSSPPKRKIPDREVLSTPSILFTKDEVLKSE